MIEFIVRTIVQGSSKILSKRTVSHHLSISLCMNMLCSYNSDLSFTLSLNRVPEPVLVQTTTACRFVGLTHQVLCTFKCFVSKSPRTL